MHNWKEIKSNDLNYVGLGWNKLAYVQRGGENQLNAKDELLEECDQKGVLCWASLSLLGGILW